MLHDFVVAFHQPTRISELSFFDGTRVCWERPRARGGSLFGLPFFSFGFDEAQKLTYLFQWVTVCASGGQPQYGKAAKTKVDEDARLVHLGSAAVLAVAEAGSVGATACLARL